MDLGKLTDKTIRITKKFPIKWNKKTRFIDLVEEIGEIANAILVKEGQKPKKTLHEGNSLPDALCDTFYDLLLISYQYGIDLEKEYLVMLKRLEKRIKAGEFKE